MRKVFRRPEARRMDNSEFAISLARDCHPERTREGSSLGRLSQILREYPQDDNALASVRRSTSYSHLNASIGCIRAARIAGTSAPSSDATIEIATITATSRG